MSKLFLDIHSIAGDVFAALTEKEPNENINGAAEDKEGDFNWQRPTGSKEDEGVDNAEANSVAETANKYYSLGKGEVAMSEGIFGAVVWMAKKFAVED